jgi:hypothetical protein
MSETKGMTYLDTIQGYVAPRLMCALGLPGNPCETATSIDSHSDRKLKELRIYPNPAKDVLNIQMAENSVEPLTVKCFDISGKLIFSINTNQKNMALDVRLLESGTYILAIDTDSKSQRTLFVKE